MDIKNLIKELGELRHDQLDMDSMIKYWERFFNSGNTPEFYLTTLDKIFVAGQRAKRKRDDAKKSIINHFDNKKLLELRPQNKVNYYIGLD